MQELIWYGVLSGLLSLVGGVFVLWNAQRVLRIVNWLIAFAAGAFLAVAFLDILPEAVESVVEPHYIFYAVLAGFTFFFGLERLLMKYFHKHPEHEDHKHDDHTEHLPALLIAGDSMHNFLDGIFISLAFIANPLLGLPTAIGIAAHEIPQEIGDFAILLDRGWSKLKIFAVNLLSSLLTLAGVLVGYWAITLVEGWIPYLMGAAAGIFIYIAASDLVPELHHRAKHRNFYSVVGSFVLGVALIAYLIFTTHAH